MKSLPMIEWPEDGDPKKIDHALFSIIGLLAELSEKSIKNRGALYLINPQPARNIDRLVNTLSHASLPIDPGLHYRQIHFGHKNRSWSACFLEREQFELALPAFFSHRPECLNIVVAGNFSDKFDPTYISRLCDFVFLRQPAVIQAPNYVGISFEADTLVEIYSNTASIDLP